MRAARALLRRGRDRRRVPVATAGRWASVRAAASVFVATRLVLLVVSLLAGRLIPGRKVAAPTLAALWNQWDVRWYVFVADHGYLWCPPPAQSDLAFFPLYPVLVHLLTLLAPLSAFAAGVLVAHLSFALALYLLHRLVGHDYGTAVAERTLWFLGLCPTALFFFTAYAEALFLACSVGCVYALRLRRWWLAGLCGAAAALTRQLGVLLLVPFLIEYGAARGWPRRPLLRRAGPATALGTPPHQTALPQPAGRDLGAALLIPAGLLPFVLYLQLRFGDGLLFLRAQRAWERSLAPPWQGVVLGVQHAVHLGMRVSPQATVALQTLDLLDLCWLTLGLALMALGVRRVRPSYTAYAAVVWLAILLAPATGRHQPLALLSIGRFAVTLFPPYLVLALLTGRRFVERLIVLLSVSLLTLFTLLFVSGAWVA